MWWGGEPVLGSMPLKPPEEYKVSVADLHWAVLINHPIRAHQGGSLLKYTAAYGAEAAPVSRARGRLLLTDLTAVLAAANDSVTLSQQQS